MKLHVPLREVSIVRTLVLISLLCCMTAASAEIYRWTDANGKQIYGDEPPENARAIEPIALPTLTVAERFKTNAKPANNQTTAPQEANEESQHKTVVVQDTSKLDDEPLAAGSYKKFSILIPSVDEVVRSNSGDLNIKLDIQPALKKDHGVVIYIDGRQASETASDSIDIAGIERGEHSVFAVLHDGKDNLLGNTEAVNFTVVRASVASASSKQRSAKADESSTLSNSRF
ncbi:MAG: DUF4124 domain-containing protein [Thiolinea sp.]